MVVTINIKRDSSGLFLATSKDALNFLASHIDEGKLRDALPLMVKVWAEENGFNNVSIRVLPPADSAAKPNRRSRNVRMAVQACSPEFVV